MMMEAVLTPSFASSSSAAQLHEFTFNKLPSLHTSVKSSSRGIHKQYALLISLSVFIWLTCNQLGQPIALMMHLKAYQGRLFKRKSGDDMLPHTTSFPAEATEGKRLNSTERPIKNSKKASGAAKAKTTVSERSSTSQRFSVSGC